MERSVNNYGKLEKSRIENDFLARLMVVDHPISIFHNLCAKFSNRTSGFKFFKAQADLHSTDMRWMLRADRLRRTRRSRSIIGGFREPFRFRNEDPAVNSIWIRKNLTGSQYKMPITHGQL